MRASTSPQLPLNGTGGPKSKQKGSDLDPHRSGGERLATFLLEPRTRSFRESTTRSMRTIRTLYACHSVTICLVWMSLTLSSPEVSRGSFFTGKRNLLFNVFIFYTRRRVSFCNSFSKKSSHEVVSCFSHKMRCFFSYIEHKRRGLCRLELNFWKINILKIIFQSLNNIGRKI